METKSFCWECYTCNELTGETGWYIKYITVFANDKQAAKDKLKLFPHFDCIITNTWSGKELDEREIGYYANGANYIVLESPYVTEGGKLIDVIY